MRLDVYLVKNELVTSRNEAKTLIIQGGVNVNGVVVTKPSLDIPEENTEVFVDRSLKKYVSRGGVKLEGALRDFNISPAGRLAIDVGASSGGFTDCLLQNGAEHVICVDSGTNQLVCSLREDLRITVMENTNARYLEPGMLQYRPSLAVMDVSFISATYIMEALYNCLAEGADFLCLIKPQFEVGRSGLGKGGIVKNAALRKDAVKRVVNYGIECGFKHIKTVESSIVGGDGNVEYFAHFTKNQSTDKFEDEK